LLINKIRWSESLDVQRSIPGKGEVVGQTLDDPNGLMLLDRSLVLGDQDCLFCQDENTPVSPFFSVYASFGYENGEKLLAGKADALCLSTFRVFEGFECVNDSLLLSGAELISLAGGPNPSSLT